MSRRRSKSAAFAFACLLLAVGCTDVRGWRKVQQANRHLVDGDARAALAIYAEAERLVPHLPQLWLGKGLACRKLLASARDGAGRGAAARCALDALANFRKVAPGDPRGEQLHTETLVEVGDGPTMVKAFETFASSADPPIDSSEELIRFYRRWRKLERVLDWYACKLPAGAGDAEVRRATSALVWQLVDERRGQRCERPATGRGTETRVP